jgi:hypothetical protein
MAANVQIYAYELGWWIYNSNTSYWLQINWVDFNPRYNATSLNNVTLISDIYVTDQATSFDLTWFKYWHEVCVAMIQILNSWDETSSAWQFSICWKKWTSIFAEFTLNYPALAPNYWAYGWSYQGVDYDEIFANWTDYWCEFKIDWVVKESIWFTISNLTVPSAIASAWSLWVEGDNLCYICKTTSTWWYKITIANDWTSYWTWEDPWMFWIDDDYDWKISYVDSSWVIRRTHLANDWSWTNSWGWSELPLTPWTWSAWKIWVSDNYNYSTWSYWYLVFVWWDWKAYRIMNWAI